MIATSNFLHSFPWTLLRKLAGNVANCNYMTTGHCDDWKSELITKH